MAGFGKLCKELTKMGVKGKLKKWLRRLLILYLVYLFYAGEVSATPRFILALGILLVLELWSVVSLFLPKGWKSKTL